MCMQTPLPTITQTNPQTSTSTTTTSTPNPTPNPQPQPVPHAPPAKPAPEPARSGDVTARLKELSGLLHAQGDMKAAGKFASQQMTEHAVFSTEEEAAAALREAYKRLSHSGADPFENLARAWLGLDTRA